MAVCASESDWLQVTLTALNRSYETHAPADSLCMFLHHIDSLPPADRHRDQAHDVPTHWHRRHTATRRHCHLATGMRSLWTACSRCGSDVVRPGMMGPCARATVKMGLPMARRIRRRRPVLPASWRTAADAATAAATRQCVHTTCTCGATTTTTTGTVASARRWPVLVPAHWASLSCGAAAVTRRACAGPRPRHGGSCARPPRLS